MQPVPHLPAQPPLASGLCRPLRCFSAGGVTIRAHNVRVLIAYLFFLPVMLPSVLPRLSTDSAVRVSWCLETSLFFKTPFPRRISVPTTFVSLFVCYIFSYLLSKPMGCFSGCLMSSPCIQKLFCGIYSAFKCSFDEFVKGETGLPVLFLCHLRTAPEVTNNSHEINRALKTILPC